jgi:hypothetical protein
MSTRISPEIRIVALVGIVAAMALGASFTLLGRGSTNAPAKPLHVIRTHSSAAAHKPSVAKPVVKATVPKPSHAKPVVKATAPKPVARPKPTVPHAPPPNGLPKIINQALAENEVVVVSLFDPQAEVDAASLGEASAGAKLAGAGFVALDVLSQAKAAPLARKLGVLGDPALLIFRRPDQLVFRVDGFVDRETVAQAASDALSGDLLAADRAGATTP